MSSWKEKVRRVTPYTPGEQPKEKSVIKLNTNENPYPPSPKVMEAMGQIEDLRKYPDPVAADLTGALADYYSLDQDQIFVGVGSDDVLAISFLTFFNSNLPILFPDITYSFYDVWAELFRIPYQVQPLDEFFQIRPEDYRKENGGIVFPNPNAPTGELMELDAVETIVKEHPDSVVIVDEAYIDFGGCSARGMIADYDNLLVVQTFSKSRSLAGLRIGFAMGQKNLIKAMNDVKYSFNSYTMNRPSIGMGVAALEDEHYFRTCCKKIIETREQTKKDLKKLGFSFGDSQSNFLFVTHQWAKAKDLFEAAKQNHIYVRYFDKPRISNYLRITIGTPEEMRCLLEFLKQYLHDHQ